MSNPKMTDFRKGQRNFKRDVRETLANNEALSQEVEKQSQRLETATTLLFGLSKRVFEMDKKLRDLTRISNASDWRSSAILEVLVASVDQNGVPLLTKDAVSAKAEQLQIADFEANSLEFDKMNNLVPVDSSVPAENEHFATVSMEYFKDGKKLEEQKTVRCKIHLGQHELFPELDSQIVGMLIGEAKKFPLNLMGRTDEVEVQLIDLRKPQSKEEPKNESAKFEGQ